MSAGAAAPNPGEPGGTTWRRCSPGSGSRTSRRICGSPRFASTDSHPEFPFLHAGAGTEFLRAGRPEVALEAFGPTPRVEGGAIEGALNHGAALLLLGRTREAIDIFQQALEKAPERGEALNNLGVAYLQMDEPKLAASNLARAAKRVDSPRIRLNLAKVPKAPPRPRAKKPAARKKSNP